MMKKLNENYEIPYGEVLEKFHNHFELPYNTNILFSGKYGIGKTSFLNSYFETRDDVVPIRISPVNYVVSPNENIFELIKADIIKQLYFKNYLNFDKVIKTSDFKKIIKYSAKNPLRLGSYLSKAFSKIHPIFEVASAGFEGVNKLIEDFEKFEQEVTDNTKSEDQRLLDFANDKTLEPGSYIEYNIISELLSKSIENVKKIKKSPILIVDDLDRLDPDHIFRILTILSSHHDLDTGNHKFGFNKVIIVCDLENIRHIFFHKYGDKVDFNGYIDKFYSEELFEFSNKDAAKFFLSNNLIDNVDRDIYFLFLNILFDCLDTNSLTIRQLIKQKLTTKLEPILLNEIEFDQFKTKDRDHSKTNRLWIDSDDTPILYLIKQLSVIFGSLREARKVLEKLNNAVRKDFKIREDIESLIKSFSLINRTIENRDEPHKIFFRQYNEYEYSKFREENVKQPDVLSWPSNNVFDIKHRIRLKWDKGNPYDSSVSYFHNHEVDRFEITNGALISSSKIYTNILSIIEYIENESLQSKLGISS